MANKNIGTLFIDTVRPYDDTYNFPVIFPNEAMGGIHMITASTDFNLIRPGRRQWGMLAYVYNEDLTYQLRPIASGTISNDDNWVIFNTGGGGGVEWVDSVLDIVVNAVSISSPSTGDRYLISETPAGAVFGTHKNKIATYNSVLNGTGGWNLGEPFNGSTLRVDTKPGILYTFTGTSSDSGRWTEEYQNAVRYIEPTSSNGKTFSFVTTDQTPLSGYTYSVYYAKFATSNSGTASLSIDGNFYAPIYKASNGVLAELTSKDFESGIRYQLTYDSGAFQINLPSSGSGVIGPAEDAGGYQDGLFTDFTTSTPVGTAVDRFNEILKFLVPPPAPDLSSWDVNANVRSGFVAGNISYLYTDQPGLGNIVSTTFSDISDVTQGDLYDKTTTRRLGIRAKDSTTNIQGILNSGVPVHPGQPTPAYATYSFGNGITGSVALYVNDTLVSSVDLLSTYGTIDSTNSSANSGLVLSAATASKFSTGSPFESFWYRTGTWFVRYDDSNINTGFNSIQVKHILPASTLTLSKFEFLTDAETTDTTFETAFSSAHSGATKWLSGIQYYKNGTSFQHNQVANNIYKNTYYPYSDAGTFADESAIQNSPIYNNAVLANNTGYQTNTPVTSTFQRAFDPDTSAFSGVLTEPGSVADPFTFTKKFNSLVGIRKIAGTTKTFVTAKRTVQGTVKGTELSISGWFLDTYPSSSSNTFEDFDDEDRRLTISSYNTVSSIPTTTPFTNWDSTTSLRIGYTNGLQVADGRLLYPHYNFTTAGDATTNPNLGQVPSKNYNGLKTLTFGNELKGVYSKSYIRAFFVGTTPPRANLIVTVNYVNTIFVSAGTTLTGAGNNSKCILEFKLPYNGTTPFVDGLGPIGGVGGAATGWLDATKAALPKKFADTDGCLVGSVPASNSTWNISFGERNTSHSNGWVLLRFTAGSEWTGYIESISVVGG